MVEKNTPRYDRSKIIAVADTYDYLQRPSFYIAKAKELYDSDVTNSSVTKAIGNWANRLRLNNSQVRKKANELLALCYFDYAAASSNLWRASRPCKTKS